MLLSYRSIGALIVGSALFAGALTGCAQGAQSSNGTSSQVKAATEEEVKSYCVGCHQASEIDAWTSKEVTPGVVKKMLFTNKGMSGDEAYQKELSESIAEYFKQKS